MEPSESRKKYLFFWYEGSREADTIGKHLTNLVAIFLGSSIRRYDLLSTYATKKVRTISITKKPLTTLSTMNSVSGLYLRNENSNGQTQAEYMTSGIRSVSHTLQEKPKLSYLSFPRVRRLGCFLKRRFSPASTPYKWHICGNYNMTWADNSPKLRDLRTTDTYPIGLNSAYWLWTIRPFVFFFFFSSNYPLLATNATAEGELSWTMAP